MDDYLSEDLPKYPLYHDEMIIASPWEDLIEDAKLKNGTLKHKLEIYKEPFFTVYKKEKLLKIGNENKHGENNQGTHFYFLDNPLNCLDSLWQINGNDKQFFVEEIIWK